MWFVNRLSRAALFLLGLLYSSAGKEKWKWKWKSLCRVESLQPHGLYTLWNSPGRNTGVGSSSLLQRIFLIQGSNPGLPHCRWILYQLSHQLRILEWIAYSFSRGSSWPRNRSWSRIHLQCRGLQFNSWLEKIPWRRKWLPTPVFWSGEFHG